MSSGKDMMKLPGSLRSTRSILTIWYSIALLVAIVLFATGVYVYLRQIEREDLERNLVEEIDWISRLVELETRSSPFFTPLDALSSSVESQINEHYHSTPKNYHVQLINIYGTILYESPGGHLGRIPAVTLPPDQTVIQSIHTPDGKIYRVATRRTDPFVTQVAFSEEDAAQVLGQLLRIFTVLVPVILFLSVAGGWILAGIVIRPVSQITQLANRISAEHLSERIPERDVPDEFGLLISTINRMFARLETSFDQIREFSHSVAHELKTPLTILKGESELALRQELSQEEVQQLISTYLEETARMSRIIDDLLTLARADEGQVVVAHDSVELFPMIKELLEDVQLLGANKELLVQLVENESSAVVTGDASRLRQLFRIIVTNAVQYTDHAGSITITSVVRSGRVQISISDSGLGISPEHVERIFERFYRVDEARSRAKGGAGLGLAIAKWIVEAHHGSIRVSSLPGSGSTFTIDLPLSVTSPLHPV